MHRLRGVTFVLVVVVGCGLLATTVPVRGPDPAGRRAGREPRRVYLLHSGVHAVVSRDGPNGAAERLRQGLARRGIPERDLVVLDSPFPAATWRDVLPRESVQMFLASADPASPTAQDAYRRLDRALADRGVTTRDEIVWVGHSAGGQIGMTMAHLAHRHDRYPGLARATRPYRFGLVITLGTPVGANPVPPEVRLRHYYSSADSVVGLLARHGSLLTAPLGGGRQLGPCCDVGPNALVRVFPGVRHHAWCSTPDVLDCIVREATGEDVSEPGTIAADTPRGLALARLLGEALEYECRIALDN